MKIASIVLGFAASLAISLSMSGAGHASEPDLTAAKRNYETYCVQCHGLRRNGTGINAPHMSVKPRDHTDPKAMGDLPDDQVFRAIKQGGLANNRSVLMPAFGSVLSDQEITDLVAYLRQVCKCGTSQH